MVRSFGNALVTLTAISMSSWSAHAVAASAANEPTYGGIVACSLGPTTEKCFSAMTNRNESFAIWMR